jgi:hypothetical protein
VPGRPALLLGHEDWATWALPWPAGAGAAGIDRSSDIGKKDGARKDDDPEVFQILNRSIRVSIGGILVLVAKFWAVRILLPCLT